MSLTKRRCAVWEGVPRAKRGTMEKEEEVVVEEKAAADVSGTREGGGIRARGYSWTPQNTVLAAASAVA